MAADDGYYGGSELRGSNLMTDTISREDILRQIFGDVGDLIDDFSCAVESTVLLHGRMYVTNRFLCFYSNLFGLEKKIRIPYSHITVITKENTVLVIPNAIAITTYRKEYVFRSFWDRDECFRMLKDFINKYKGVEVDSPAAVAAAAAAAATQSRHRAVADVREHSSSVDGIISGSSTSVAAAGGGGGKGGRARSLSDGVGVGRNSSHSMSDGTHLSPLDLAAIARLDENSSDEDDTEVGIRGGGAAGGEAVELTPVENAKAFREEVERSRLRLAVINETIPLSVSEFAAMFVEESAPHSWLKYHELVHDSSLEATEWKDQGAQLGFGREIKFFKPVNLPGLKSTRGVKVQRFRRFGDFGLVVCSSTRLEDVPAADTFSVEDMICVSMSGSDPRKILVEITFEVKFLKSTMFKYVIQSSTENEMTKWLEAFFGHLKKCAREPHAAVGGKGLIENAAALENNNANSPSNRKLRTKHSAAAANAHDDDAKAQLPLGAAGGRLFWLAWLLLLVATIFCAWQYRTLHAKMDRLNARMSEFSLVSAELLKALDAIKAIKDGDCVGPSCGQ